MRSLLQSSRIGHNSIMHLGQPYCRGLTVLNSELLREGGLNYD